MDDCSSDPHLHVTLQVGDDVLAYYTDAEDTGWDGYYTATVVEVLQPHPCHHDVCVGIVGTH